MDSGQKTVVAGTTASTAALCLPGEVPTGGGHQIITGDNTVNPAVTVGESMTPTGWFITVFNPGPNDITIRATAECAMLVDAP